MVKEVIIQKFVEKLISNGKLYGSIANVEEADASMYSIDNEEFIPNFPIDYLMRRRCLEAAQHVLGKLHDLEIVSASLNNVSLKIGERLFPDIVCFNHECGAIVLVEIKRSKKTERETATEILAYEHEIRNHFPFLSNLDICHVIIATEFDTLLDHSVAGMATWSAKQTLCLKASFKSGKLSLAVHIPNVWTSIGQQPIPKDALVTIDLYLYPLLKGKEPAKSKIFRVAETALNMFARDGDRYQSHGFAMLWRDLQHSNDGTSGRLAFTIGFVNPFSFMDAALSGNFIQKGRTKLVDFVSKSLPELQIAPLESGMGMVCKQGKAILNEVCRPTWESYSSWDEVRSPPLDPSARIQGLHHRAFPIQFEFWGALGDFARQYIVMPAIRHSYNKIIGHHKLDWRDPFIAIGILDRLIGLEHIKNGRFTCSSMFMVGVELGSFATINWTIKTALEEENSVGNMPALLRWQGASLASCMNEIAFRCESSLDDIPRPPTITISQEDGYAPLDQITALAQWIATEFLQGNPLHQSSFDAGLKAHAVLNPYFSSGVDKNTEKEIRKEILRYGRAGLRLGLEYYNQAKNSGSDLNELTSRFDVLGLKRLRGNYKSADIGSIKYDTMLRNLISDIIQIYDYISFPVAHTLTEIAEVGIDWGWMKSQIKEMKTKGWSHPAVLVTGDGGYSVYDAGVIGSALTYDPETQVLYTNEIGGAIPTTIVTTWEDLKSGIFDFKKLLKNIDPKRVKKNHLKKS